MKHWIIKVLIELYVLALAIILCLAVSAFAHATSASPFAGKFELVPLFDKGHRPVIRNGHQFYAERNTISFRADDGDTVTAFAGSTTDLASIPQIVWPFMPPDGPWAEAAAFHDACYRTKGTFDWQPVIDGHAVGQFRHGRTRGPPYDYHGCNEILREAMVALHVPAWERISIFEAVEIFGRSSFGT